MPSSVFLFPHAACCRTRPRKPLTSSAILPGAGQTMSGHAGRDALPSSPNKTHWGRGRGAPSPGKSLTYRPLYGVSVWRGRARGTHQSSKLYMMPARAGLMPMKRFCTTGREYGT